MLLSGVLKLRLIRIELENGETEIMKDTIVLLFNRPLNVVKNLISALLDLFVKTVEPVKPNRKFPRNHKIQKRGFHPFYKPVR